MSARLAAGDRFAALWRSCHSGPQARPPDPIYADLVARYGEPHRRYHTIGHVDDCLERFDAVRHLTEEPAAVELALWLHDAICTPGARDNERRSAELYLAHAAGATPRFQRHVCSMILASRHCGPCHGDWRYVCDIDLAGFAHRWPKFRDTTDLVRAEFPHQSDAEFARALAPFLESLQARPHVFFTSHFRERCEAPARANIAALLDEWRSAGYLTRSV
jgi:predicted metal-dependent HD superfamily phosphohydrolase